MARSIADITDPSAVLKAMEEYDRLGQDAFLSRYGYRQARAYRLQGDAGRDYDSKAILGVAYGYQFPGEEPLKASEFSGGEQTVQRRLEALGFQVIREPTRGVDLSDRDERDYRRRNPAWQRDELILALDAYMHFQGNPPSHSAPEIAELSKTLNQFHVLIGTPHADTLRNTNGVYMKLMNFRRFDPVFTAQGKAGLNAGGKLEEEIWNEFHSDPQRLTWVAKAIRRSIDEQMDALGQGNSTFSTDDESDDGYQAIEGRMLTRQHRAYERDRKLVDRKKQQAMRRFGKLACEVCGFDFRARYGERGAGFIECHHIRPVSELLEPRQTSLNDLALLCANCHRMVHAKRPWWTIEELSCSVGENGNQN